MEEARLADAAAMFAETFASLVSWLFTWWTAGKDPGPAGVRTVVMQAWPVVSWVTAGVLVLCLVVLGATFMVRRNGADIAAGFVGLGRVLLVMSGGWLLVSSAWSLSDALSHWLLAGSFDARAYSDALLAACGDLEPVLGLMLCGTGVVAALALLIVIMVRFLLVLTLTAVLPVAAAVSVAGARMVFNRAAGWLIAALVFRPLACLVCRFGLLMQERVDEALLVVLLAVVTPLLAAATLPAAVQMLGGRA